MAFQTKAPPILVVFCLTLLLHLAQPATHAFSLLGPFAPWMTPEVGYIPDESYDIGGPRNLGDEFRWNVPVLTYGFDQNFKDFFGQPGIDAVEQAVAILNALPPASQMDLSQFPPETRRVNQTAQSMEVRDLKSYALMYLVEQLGLANAVRFVWNTTSTNIAAGSIEENGPYDSMIKRNFDPITLEPSSHVNGSRFSFRVDDFLRGTTFSPQGARIAVEFEIQPEYFTSVAGTLPDFFLPSLRAGEYFIRLTRDDVGGLRYLLHTNNINVESTLRSIRAVNGSTNFVKTTPRPGIDKISLQRLDPGTQPLTNVFTDIYVDNGQFKEQTLRRVVEVPDIIFTAANHPRLNLQFASFVRRTRPNYSHVNSTGSGIFHPEVVISFNKLGDIYREPLFQEDGTVLDPRWSSFDSFGTTPTTIFPVGPAYQGGRTLSIRKLENPPAIEWTVRLISGVRYDIETSTDLKTWTALTNITAMPIHTLTNAAPTESGFYRARRVP